MKMLNEGNISFDFDKLDYVINFDNSGEGHGLSHIFKAVDFIAEDKNLIYFIEVKDAENNKIPPEYKDKNIEEFVNNLKNGSLKEDLLFKFYDSVLFRAVDFGMPQKPILYIVLICCGLDEAQLMSLRDSLIKMKIKNIAGKSTHTIFNNTAIFNKKLDVLFVNLETWNRYFPNMPATRLAY